MASVLVLESHHQTLPVVRSLGRAGFTIVLGKTQMRHEARYSRYVSEVWLHQPLDDIHHFCDAVNKFLADRPDIVAIYPVAETCRRLLIEHNLSFSKPTVGVPADLFTMSRDKLRANRLAAVAGLRVPAACASGNLEDLVENASALGFPVIVKPYKSQAALFSGKAFIAENEDALRCRFGDWPKEHNTLLVQQYVEGVVHGADFVARAGEIIGYCEATTQRTDALDGTGYGVLFKSKAPTRDLYEATKLFVSVNQYEGPGLIQFIQDASQNLHFLENNPRLSAGVASSVQWGQDMPLLALEARCPELFSHKSVVFNPDIPSYECDTEVFWLTREIHSYLEKRHNVDAKSKKIKRRQMWQSLSSTSHHIVWQWRDPLPALYLTARLVMKWVRER